MTLRAYIDRRIGKSTNVNFGAGDVISVHLSTRGRPGRNGDPASDSNRNARNSMLIVEGWEDDDLEAYMLRNDIDIVAYPYQVTEEVTLPDGSKERRQRRRSRKRLALASLVNAGVLEADFNTRKRLPRVNFSDLNFNNRGLPSASDGGTLVDEEQDRVSNPRRPRIKPHRTAGNRYRKKPAYDNLNNLSSRWAAASQADRKPLAARVAATVLEGITRRRFGVEGFPGLEIKIHKVRLIQGKGVEVYLQAWQGENQRGFGKTGTVDIERLTLINPSMGVDGTVDPLKGVTADIARSVARFGKDGAGIIPGKIGRSSYTIGSEAGDGYTRKDDATFATCRTNDADSVDHEGTSRQIEASDVGADFRIQRCHFPFDTSSIGASETIDSATLTLSFGGITDTDSVDVDFLEGDMAASSTLAVGDHEPLSYTSIADSIALSSTPGYQEDIPLTDTSIIAKGSGFTKITTAISRDTDNSAPTGVNTITVSFVEQVSAGFRPSLFVETSGDASVTVGATGGRDYADFATAEADLGAGARTWTCYEGGDLGALTLNDTDPSSLVIEVAVGNGHDGISGGTFSTGSFSISAGFGAIGDLTVRGLHLQGAMTLPSNNADPVVLTFEEILQTYVLGVTNLCTSAVSHTFTWRNCIMRTGFYTGHILSGLNQTLSNCTIVRDSDTLGALRFLRNGTGTILAENCYAVNQGDGPGIDTVIGSTGTTTLNNCASHDDTADDYLGSNNVLNATAATSVVDIEGSDMRPITGGPLDGAGKTIVAVTDDIVGVSRPVGDNYTIGAHEATVYVAGGLPNKFKRNLFHLWRKRRIRNTPS